MIPSEVKQEIKTVIKQEYEAVFKGLLEELARANARIANLEIEVKILKEGDNL